MTFVADGETVLATLSRDSVHRLENKFYQLRDELMTVRMSLIDGTASDFDFFRYCTPLSPERRRIIKMKFRAVILKFMYDLKANNNQTQLKTLGLLQVMIKARRQKDKEFDEFKRSAGIRDDNHELIKNTLLPIPYLVQAREKGIMRNYMSSNQNT